jgi:tetratricopeptide (TPR) repeat protein
LTDANDTTALDALIARAVEHHRQGRVAEALMLYNTVVRAAPDNAVVHCNRGIALQVMGRLEEAIRSYDHAIRCQPGYAEAYFSKAIALGVLKRPQEALRNYDLAVRFKPDHLAAWRNKGNVLWELGQPDDALLCFERAIAIVPDSAAAHYERANALRALDRFDEALASYDLALALQPDFAEALCNRGNVLCELKRHDQALASYDRAIRAGPTLALTHICRGKALESLNRPEESLASFERAIELQPDNADAFCNRGNVMNDLKRIDEAIESYEHALALCPDFAAALCGKGICKLLLGDFDEGWPLYEWRPTPNTFVRTSQFRWTRHEDLEGTTILVQAEQGLGDTIQFCRYALLAQERGARVVFAVQDGLVRLLATLGDGVAIVPQSVTSPACDLRIALLSLPYAFGTDASNVPARIPYLSAESGRVTRWNAWLGNHGFKVGICWQGNKESPSDLGRSFPLLHFERLARIAGVRLVSLQKHDGVDQIAGLPAGTTVETLEEGFDAGPDAFLDAAAVMQDLDFIITSDTAIAHLAGALGRPVWVALKYVPDWRWFLDRSDSPWYPTMRLFRQTARNDWRGVFNRMENELRMLARQKEAGQAGQI